MATHDNSLHDYTIKFLAKMVEALEKLEEEALQTDWYIQGPIRIQHRDGWSPGYFDLSEDWVQFFPDYQEDEP